MAKKVSGDDDDDDNYCNSDVDDNEEIIKSKLTTINYETETEFPYKESLRVRKPTSSKILSLIKQPI